jgi:hypothetical protein
LFGALEAAAQFGGRLKPNGTRQQENETLKIRTYATGQKILGAENGDELKTIIC